VRSKKEYCAADVQANVGWLVQHPLVKAAGEQLSRGPRREVGICNFRAADLCVWVGPRVITTPPCREDRRARRWKPAPFDWRSGRKVVRALKGLSI
jgi:hypothetical protein